MIRHVYLYKLKDREMAKTAAEKILTMKNAFPYMKELDVGVDFKGAENSYDLCEICTFETMEDFLKFGAESYHDQIRKYMSAITETGCKADYVMGEI